MTLRLNYIFILFALFVSSSFKVSNEVKPIKILSQMNDSIKNIKTLTVNIAAIERLETGFNKANYENKNFGYVDYTVGEKETVSSISAKLIVNDYLVRFKNDLLNDYGYIKRGKIIKVPNLFCKKATLYIDEKLMLPIIVSLSDEVG